MNAQDNQNPPVEEAVFAAMDNFHVEHLRLENAWLRERLENMRLRAFHGEQRPLRLDGDRLSGN